MCVCERMRFLQAKFDDLVDCDLLSDDFDFFFVVVLLLLLFSYYIGGTLYWTLL